MSYYLFPFHLVGKGSKIILYGAGAVMRDYVDQLKATDYCEILFAVDREYNNKQPYKRVKVASPADILTSDYDKVVTAVSAAHYDSILADLSKLGVPRKRIISNEPIPVNDKKTKLPNDVWLDASTFCQLKCKSCSFQRSKSTAIGKGFLSFENFKKFVDNNKFVESIGLSNYGEIFLNPDIVDIIKYAKEQGVSLNADAGVNFNNVTDEMLEALVLYGFERITISMDGASQEVYSQYRIGGNFDTVITNVKKLISLKSKYRSNYPKLLWQYVLMSQTEADVGKAKEMAKKLDIPIYFKLTWDRSTDFKEPEKLKQETGLEYLTREEYKKVTDRVYHSEICDMLFVKPQINWDGRLLGCCKVMQDDFGINVFDVGLKTALESPNYVLAKKMVTGKAPAPENPVNLPCANCPRYRTMLDTSCFLNYK